MKKDLEFKMTSMNEAVKQSVEKLRDQVFPGKGLIAGYALQ